MQKWSIHLTSLVNNMAYWAVFSLGCRSFFRAAPTSSRHSLCIAWKLVGVGFIVVFDKKAAGLGILGAIIL